MMRSRWLIAIALTASASLAPGIGSAQAPTGAFVRVATWEDTATTIPGGVWSAPSGIDVTAGGTVVVSDKRLRRIEVLDGAGNPQRSFGRGTSPQDLVAPGHVAVDEGRDRVYVADSGAARVAVYTIGGARVALWPGIAGASGVAVAPDGRVLVSDTNGDRIRVFAPDGTEQAGWGGPGKGPAEYDYPAGLHVDAAGVVWVADRVNARIVGTDLSGQAVDVVRLNAPELEGAEPLDVASDGENVWVATTAGLVRLARERGILRSFFRDTLAAAVTLHPAHGLFAAVDPADGHAGVWQYRYKQASGEPIAQWGGPITVPGFFDGLEALTIGHDGKALLLDVPPRIQRLALNGVVEGQIESPDPVEADADPSGAVYAAAGDTVYGYAPDGAPLWQTRLRSAAPGRETDVSGLAWDEMGSRIVTLDGGGRRLYYLDRAGAVNGDWALKGTAPGAQYWVDVAVAPDGTRYALDAGGSQIRGWGAGNRLTLEIDLSEPALRMDLAGDGSFFVLSPSGWARHIATDGSVLAEWDVTRLDRGRPSRPADIAVDDAGRVYVVDGGADIVTVYEWDPDATAEKRPAVEKGCEVMGDKMARPLAIELGETVEVALVVRGQCAPGHDKADIALIIDNSMDRSRLKAARRAAEHFLTLISPAYDQVTVNGSRLTSDVQFLRRVIRRIEEADVFSLGGALTAAEDKLFGRRGRPGVKKVIIVLLGSSRGEDVPYWEYYWVKRAAGQAKRRGAEIFVITFGRQADEQLANDVASSRDHVYRSRGTWQLDQMYARIAETFHPTRLLAELVIEDEIPANMEFVAGSSDPPATLKGRTLEWRYDGVPLAGIGARYRLRPTALGEWPTNVYARGEYVDVTGAAGVIDFPIPIVRVGAPTPTPSPSPPASATPQASPSPSPTATREVTPTKEPTPTPTAQRVYLPLALREVCDPQTRHADVALVIDASTSMRQQAGAGRSKLAYATAAAGLLLDRLDYTHDQAAIIVFNRTAELLQELTAKRSDLDAALSGIQTDKESRINLGIARARAELVSGRHRSGNQRAMVVLTDGLANPSSPEEAVREADVAKADGVEIFTVGLGDHLDFAALRAIASRPEFYYRAPRAEELARIYEAIAGEIPCPRGAFWGQR